MSKSQKSRGTKNKNTTSNDDKFPLTLLAENAGIGQLSFAKIESKMGEWRESSEAFANPDPPGKLSIWTANLTSIRVRSTFFFCFPAEMIDNARGTDKPMKLSKAKNKDGRRRIDSVIIDAVLPPRWNFRTPWCHLKMDPSWWIPIPVTLVSSRLSVFWSTCSNRNENPKSRINKISNRKKKKKKTMFRKQIEDALSPLLLTSGIVSHTIEK